MEDDSESTRTSDVVLLHDEDSHSDSVDEGQMQCIFTWCIENFSCSQLNTGEELCSPFFVADSAAKWKWYLSIFPHGQTGFEDYVSVHLVRQSAKDELCNTRLHCKISFMDNELNAWHSEKNNEVPELFQRFQFDTFVKRQKLFDEKSKVLPSDTLTINCQICAYNESDFDLIIQNFNGTENYHHKLLRSLSNDLKSLYKSGKFSDVTLITKNGNIHVHKVVLIARSLVFKELLSDSSRSEIDIPFFEKCTVEALLSYIYSGEIDVVSASSSLELYEAADKYNICELKRSITPSMIVARTEIIKDNFSFRWRLKNFSSIIKSADQIIYSNKFHTGSCDRLWRLSLHFRRTGNGDDDEEIGIYLNKMSFIEKNKAVFVVFKICLLDKNDEPCFAVEMQQSYKQQNSFGFPSFVKKSVILSNSINLLPTDTLTVRCDMKVGDGTALSKIEHSHLCTSTNLLEINDVKHLSDSFKEMFSLQTNSDVTVCSGNRKFFLHRAILSARSPVFAKFFESLTSNLKPYTIDVSGIKPKVLESLFYFIYTGELEDLSCEIAPNLYAAANHYEILDIKMFCSNFLKSNLSVSNALQTMSLCKSVPDESLKDFVKDFICCHADELINGTHWQNFIKEHEDISNEIITSLADEYRKSKRRRIL